MRVALRVQVVLRVQVKLQVQINRVNQKSCDQHVLSLLGEEVRDTQCVVEGPTCTIKRWLENIWSWRVARVSSEYLEVVVYFVVITIANCCSVTHVMC